MDHKKHLLVYDVEWWVLGKHAQIIKEYHQILDIMSLDEFYQTIAERGPNYLNEKYEVISTMCLGIAHQLIANGVRVDSSAAESNYYFMDNHWTFREWADQPQFNYAFIDEVVKKHKAILAINTNLAKHLSSVAPKTKVKYVKQFVNTEHFRPLEVDKNEEHFVVGWVGDTEKYCKNYYTTYLKIVEALKDHPQIKFKEATKSTFYPLSEMPGFYNSLDLLVITGNHEGGPAPILEAYACGIPVVSTNIGYVKDVSPPEVYNLILNTNDPQAFITKINELAGKKSEVKELGKVVHKYVHDHFTKNNTVKDWVKQLFYFNQS